MDPTISVNERVDVVAIYKKGAGVSTNCFPYRMTLHNQEIVFTKLGMRHPTAQGRRMLHVFDMSDDANDYRLEFDSETLTWTLVAIIEGRR